MVHFLTSLIIKNLPVRGVVGTAVLLDLEGHLYISLLLNVLPTSSAKRKTSIM